VSNASWLTVGTPSGTGSGPASFTAAANPTLSQRNGTVTVAGQTFTVTQAANTCTYSIAPTGQNVAAAGGTASTTVTASEATCAWTAVSNASWLTVDTASGTGSGPASFTAAANPTLSQRNGTVTVAGQTFTVTQAANTCTYTLSSTSETVAGSGATTSTTVTPSAESCDWSAVSNESWLTITAGASGPGTATVLFTASINPLALQRTGTATIAGQTFTVTQTAGGCTYSIAPAGQTVSVNGGTASTTVTPSNASCDWAAISNASWVTVVTGASATGTGPASFNVAPNPNTSQRSGTVTIGERTFTITQTGCTFSILPTIQNVSASAGTTSTAVTASGTACVWTSVSNNPWITVTNGSGEGSGTATFTYTANSTTSQRVGTVTVAGRTFTIGQAGVCSYSITPATRNVSATAGSSSAFISTTSGCQWSATASQAWITVSSSGSGSGTMNYSFAANLSSQARTATIAVGNQVHTVTQAGTTAPAGQKPPSAPSNFRISGGNQ